MKSESTDKMLTYNSLKVLFTDITGLPFYDGGAKSRILGELYSLVSKVHTYGLLCYIKPADLICKFNKLVLFKKQLARYGVKFYFIPSLPLKRYLFIRKMNEQYLAFMTYLFVILKNYSLVHAQTSNASKIAVLVKKKYPALKVVADIHGIEPEEYLLNSTKKDNHYLYLEANDYQIIDYADWIIYSSEMMYRFFCKKYKNHSNYTAIPCAVSKENLIHVDQIERNRRRERFEINKKIVFCYSGTIAAYQMIDQTLRLFKEITDFIPDTFLLILTPNIDEMKKKCKEQSISENKFTIIKARPSELPQYLQMADFGFLVRDKIFVNKVASPVKFGDYISNGVPVIASDEIGDISEIIKKHNIGFIITDLIINSALIEYIGVATKNREEISINCITFVNDEYNWDKYGNMIVDIYNSLGKDRNVVKQKTIA